jgi:hypothetical protein
MVGPRCHAHYLLFLLMCLRSRSFTSGIYIAQRQTMSRSKRNFIIFAQTGKTRPLSRDIIGSLWLTSFIWAPSGSGSIACFGKYLLLLCSACSSTLCPLLPPPLHRYLMTHNMAARQSTPRSNHSHSYNVRKRVCKACDRCRLRKSKVCGTAAGASSHKLTEQV